MMAAPSRRSPLAERADPRVRRWIVAPSTHWQPSVFLANVRRETQTSEAELAEILRHGGLWVNRKRATAEAPPHAPAGARIAMYHFVRAPELPPIPDDVVLAEVGGVVAINKPAWWPIQGTRASQFVSLEAALRIRLNCPTLTPVHRLDRQTSGVVLFARDGETAARLHAAFRARKMQKTYLAQVAGRPPTTFTVAGQMVRRLHPSHSLFAVSLDPTEAGRWSETRFKRLDASGPHSLMQAQPITGRTHQIRAHLAHVGTPILGDTLYHRGWRPGDPEALRLHAQRLEFMTDGVLHRFEAPPPPWTLDAAQPLDDQTAKRRAASASGNGLENR